MRHSSCKYSPYMPPVLLEPSAMVMGWSEIGVPLASVGSTWDTALDPLCSTVTWKPARNVWFSLTCQLASVCSPLDMTEREADCEMPLNSRSPSIGSGEKYRLL